MKILLGVVTLLSMLSQNAGVAKDEKHLSDLEQIDSFTVQMVENWGGGNVLKEESVALVVNPFSVRKRGKYYGSVYEYHRNDNFDARNFFDPVGEPLPEFKRNQFGFSIGGFVAKRLKAFGSYDGLRIIKGSTMLSMVPTPEMKRGDFSSRTGLAARGSVYSPALSREQDPGRTNQPGFVPVAGAFSRSGA